MDNRQLNINGKGTALLSLALKTAFLQWGDHTKALGWTVTKAHGLSLHWAETPKINHYMTPLSDDLVCPLVEDWLSKNKPDDFDLTQWDQNADHDGHNGVGWRIYVEDWGHVGGWSVICAVKPVYLWYGK